ncbi:MAG: hypothetical protein AB1729_03960 [Pseudomonadota bacterium]
MRYGPLGIAPGLVARGSQLGDPILERRVAYIDHTILDRLIESAELGVRLGRPALKLGGMKPAFAGPLIPTFENLIHQVFKPLRIE